MNRFAFPDEGEYDFAVCITTLPNPSNMRRVEQILRLLKKHRPDGLSWNVYLAYDGDCWSDALNKALAFLVGRVRYGVVLLDDDAFPSSNWSQNLEAYISLDMPFQFALCEHGHVLWERVLFPLPKPLSLILHTFTVTRRRHKYPSPAYLVIYEKRKPPDIPNQLIKVHRISFSACYLPRKAILETGQVENSHRILHYEDQDYSFRMLEKGFVLYTTPNLVYHIGRATKRQQIRRQQDLKITSRLEVYQRFFSNAQFISKLRSLKLLKPKPKLFSRLRLEVVP